MEKQKIFPSFKRQNKWLGIIDYKSLIFLGVYLYTIYLICSIFKLETKDIATTLIVLSVPIFAIYIANIKEESTIDIIIVIFKFYISKKEFYYKIKKIDELEMPIKTRKNKKINVEELFKRLNI